MGQANEKVVSLEELEQDWDSQMIKSVQPGEDEDDDDDEEEEDEDEENEAENENEESPDEEEIKVASDSADVASDESGGTEDEYKKFWQNATFKDVNK